MNGINAKLARYLRYGLWACLYLTLATPLLIGAKFLFPFISLKTFYFRIIVEAALFIYFLLVLVDANYRPRFNKLVRSILIFCAVVFLTGLAGVNFYRSFWGTIERGEGILTISHLIFFCFLLSQILRTRQQWLNYFSASIFVSFLVGLYAIAQEYTQISWIINTGGGRLSSTVGNAAYLGAYSLGHFWLCLLLFFERKKIFWRILFGLLTAFELYVLWQSETRGALIALISTLILLLILVPLFHRQNKVKAISLCLLAFLVFGSVFVWGSRHSEWIKKSNTLNRVANISVKDITTQSRLLAWDSSWRGWRDRFLIGYGWENYNVAFNKYFHAEIFKDNGSQIWFDRAHNTVFDVAVASGLIGLLVYLSIFAISFYYLAKFTIKDRDNLWIYLVAGAFLLAHFIQNIFVFDCLATYIMLFMVLGFVGFVINKHQDNYPPAKPVSKSTKRSLAFAPIGLVVFILALLNFNLLPAKANLIALDGMKDFYANRLDSGLNRLKQAIGLDTYQTPEIRQKLADNIISLSRFGNAEDDAQNKNRLQLAIDETKNNIESAPLDVQNYLYLMILYNATSHFDVALPDQVIKVGEEALKLSPTRPQIYFEMGQALISLRKFKEGVSYFQKAVALNPENLDSRWLLLTAYIITGQNQEAELEYQTMVRYGLVEIPVNLERLAGLYQMSKNYFALAKIYDKLVQLEPRKTEYWLKLADAYKNAGDLAAYNRVIELIIEQNPKTPSTTSRALLDKK